MAQGRSADAGQDSVDEPSPSVKQSKLFLWLAAAGRDPSAFSDPDTFDLHRTNARRHLAFGKGIHFCIGSALGKLEARLALEALITRFPGLRLVPGQTLTFHPNISFRGPQALLAQVH